MDKRMTHLQWSDWRPPLLAYDSYVLVQKDR